VRLRAIAFRRLGRGETDVAEERYLENISDTARWTAVFRAWESKRPDAVFRDPFAEWLAGERGEQIVRQLGTAMYWTLVVRTAALDQFVKLAISEGADTILNLAAGLDTRPYRMELPKDLHWIEVDLEGITRYKESKLSGETPRCRLTRVVQDLADRDARQILFERVNSESKRVAVLTEGLLVYLHEPVVVDLAKDLRAQPTFRYWLHDFVLPPVLVFVRQRMGKALEKAKSPMVFAPAEGPDYYLPLGWKPRETRYAIDEAKRLGREMRFVWLWRLLGSFSPREKQRSFRRWAGYTMLEPS
jgi:methyltransferase (TIGR00027 family)